MRCRRSETAVLDQTDWTPVTMPHPDSAHLVDGRPGRPSHPARRRGEQVDRVALPPVVPRGSFAPCPRSGGRIVELDGDPPSRPLGAPKPGGIQCVRLPALLRRFCQLEQRGHCFRRCTPPARSRAERLWGVPSCKSPRRDHCCRPPHRVARPGRNERRLTRTFSLCADLSPLS